MSANLAPKNHVFYRNQNWRYPKIEYGQGIYLYGPDGKRYLDAASGAVCANIGHGNVEVAEHMKKQAERIAFTHLSRFTADCIEEAADRIAKLCPEELGHIYYVSGGSEATESALKLARQYFVERDGLNSSKWKIISKWNSYHGNTIGALSMTGCIAKRNKYDPMLLDYPHIPQFYHYRNVWGCATLEETSIKAAQALETEILRHGAQNIAAFISEPVVGSGAPGVHPTPTYFKMVREICDRYDVLFIMDEVMSGCGRTGKKMALEHFDAKPDIICMAKGLSSGYTPFGAIAASDKVFNTIMVKGSGSFVHGHTYAGNPLSCAVVAKVLEIVEREGYIENAAVQGDYLMSKLQDLYKYPIVGDIRGKGLQLGIEFVADQKTKEPFEAARNVKGLFTNAALEAGLVPYPGGGNVDGTRGDDLLVTPPLCITHEQVDELYGLLETSIANVCQQLKMPL